MPRHLTSNQGCLLSSSSLCPTPRSTSVQIAERSRSVAVSGLQLADDQSSIGDQVVDGPIQMAASGDTAVCRVEAVLPSTYGFGWRPPVLEEMQLTARLEHPMNLLEGRIDGGNGAQRVGGQHTVHGS